MENITPENMSVEMSMIYYFLHPFRNRPYRRYFYYNAFIEWVGRKNWQKVMPEIRNAWEEALSNFDKQRGLIKSLEHITSPEEIMVEENTEQSATDDLSACSNHIDEINKKLESVFKIKKERSEQEITLLCDLIDTVYHSSTEWKKIKDFLMLAKNDTFDSFKCIEKTVSDFDAVTSKIKGRSEEETDCLLKIIESNLKSKSSQLPEESIKEIIDFLKKLSKT